MAGPFRHRCHGTARRTNACARLARIVPEAAANHFRRGIHRTCRGAPETASEAACGPAAAPPPPLPPADRGFEETIGTRWVVWIGGLTLALGGFFMVRYSIEAGLLGPGVRTMLGGAVRAGAACRRRMDPPQGKHLEYRGAADRQYPGDSHRRRHGGGVCNGVRGLCALWIPGARHRLHPARAGGAGHAGRGAAARAGARRSRRRRRLRDPDPGFLRQARLLGALCLSRDRHRGRLRPGAGAAVALACGHHDRVRAVVDVPVPAMRTLDGRSACVPRDRRLHPRRPARGVRLHVRPAGRARPDRADLILLARRLSGRRHADRAEQFSRRHRDDRLRPAGGRQLDRGLA